MNIGSLILLDSYVVLEPNQSLKSYTLKFSKTIFPDSGKKSVLESAIGKPVPEKVTTNLFSESSFIVTVPS